MKLPKNPLNELGRKMFVRDLQRSCIATFRNCVVVYELTTVDGVLDQLLNLSEVEKKLGDILRANPDADLMKYEEALGIKIIDVQRKKTSPELTEDNILGDIR